MSPGRGHPAPLGRAALMVVAVYVAASVIGWAVVGALIAWALL